METRRFAQRVRLSDAPINVLADHFGIRVVRDHWKNDPRMLRGPSGSSMNPIDRIGYADPKMHDDLKDIYHELIHVLMYVPGGSKWSDGVEYVDEACGPMQLERQMAKACFGKEDLAQIVEYQEVTAVWGFKEILAGHHDYENDPRWVRGMDLCRRVGVLDDNLFPTFRWPDWSVLHPNEINQLLRTGAPR